MMKKRRLAQQNSEVKTGDVLTPEEEALLHDLSGASHGEKPLPPPLILPQIPAAEDIETPCEADGSETEEGALLRALLRSAYPSPSADLQKNVMAKIAVLSKRRRIRRMAVKWGSAAACFVMLCSLVIAANPMLRMDSTAGEMAVAADKEAAIYDVEMTAETGAEPADTMESYMVEAEDADTEPTEDAPLYAASQETEMETEEAVETEPETAADRTAPSANGTTPPKKQTNGTKETDKQNGTASDKKQPSGGTSGGTTPPKKQTNGSANTKNDAASGNGKNKTEAGTETGSSAADSTAGGSANKTQTNETPETGGRTYPDIGAPVIRAEESETETEKVTPPRYGTNEGHVWNNLVPIDGSAANANGKNSQTNGSGTNDAVKNGSVGSGNVANDATSNSAAGNGASSHSESAANTTPTETGTTAETSSAAGANSVQGTDSAVETAAGQDTSGSVLLTQDELSKVFSLTQEAGNEPTPTGDDAPAEADSGTDIAEDALVSASLLQNKGASDPLVVAESQMKWTLITYLAPEKYAKWMTENGYFTAADFTLPDLVAGMQIPYETFHAVVVMLGLERQIDECRFYKPGDLSNAAPDCRYMQNNSVGGTK